MKVNKIGVLIFAISLILILGFLYFRNSAGTLTIRPMGNRGVFVGSKNRLLIDDEQYKKDAQAIHEAGEDIRLGNSYDDIGRYEEALEAYKKAYDIDPADRVFIAKKLIKTYEQMSRYDDALAVANEILKTEKLAPYGIEKWNATRTRLLAAKAKAGQQRQTVSVLET